MSIVFAGGGHQPRSDQPADAVATMASGVSALTDIPSDPDWHDEAVLLAEFATLNQRIAKYVTRMLDADAKRGEPVHPADEAVLGRALVEFGERLGERARRQPPPDATATTDVPSPRAIGRIAPSAFPERPQTPAFHLGSGPNQRHERR